MTLLIPAAVLLVVVNSTTVLMEARRTGRSLDAWEPFLWEGTSLFITLLLAPLVGQAVARWPFRRENLRGFAIHAALTLPYSLVHVAGMVALRKLAYAMVGRSYDFIGGQPLITFIYEWRKDVVTYGLVALIFWLWGWRVRAMETAGPPARIEIRDGGTAVFLDPAEVLFVEAAGNYVEFHAGGRTHLVRGTLGAWETKLAGRGFARAHRSRLINRARIRTLKPSGSGDLEVTLDDGRTVLASRRYRAALKGPVRRVRPL
jgi:hypothetical protein